MKFINYARVKIIGTKSFIFFMMALCLSLVSKADEDSSANNLIGKINFYSCESKTYQDVQRILSVDSQDILTEALQTDQCQRITSIDFQTAAEFLDAEDTHEVLQIVTVDPPRDQNLQLQVFNVYELHLNAEQFLFLSQLAKENRDKPSALVKIFFLAAESETFLEPEAEGNHLFFHIHIQKASFYVERLESHPIEYDPTQK